MMTPQMNRIAIGGVIVIAGCGAVLLIAHQGRHPGTFVPPSIPSIAVIAPPLVHTAAWYVAHPDALKQDEQRCAGDAATIPQAACQNVASADAQVAAGDFAKAAAQNGAADAKTPNGP